MERETDGVRWVLEIDGTLIGTDSREGVAINTYTAADACRAALRKAIEDDNAFRDVAGS